MPVLLQRGDGNHDRSVTIQSGDLGPGQESTFDLPVTHPLRDADGSARIPIHDGDDIVFGERGL